MLCTEDPSFHMLCLYDKDSEARNKNVIDLRCSVRSSQRDVVNPVIRFGIVSHGVVYES